MNVLKVEATEAKSGFAHWRNQAQKVDVAITKRGRVQAYLVSPERYRLLESVSEPGSLDALDASLEALVARMQTPAQAEVARQLETAPLDDILAAGATPKSKTAARRRPTPGRVANR